MLRVIFGLFLTFLFNTIWSQQVEGEVYFMEEPLEGVNIINVATKMGTVSNSLGSFSIAADIGDDIVFSFLGMKEVRLTIRDYNPLVIQMTKEYNELDQATVLGRKKLPKNTFQKSETFHSFFGEQDLENAGYAISQVRGSEIVNSAAPEGIIPAYVKALEGKIAGYRVARGGVVLRQSGSITQETFALWEIDGQIYNTWPPPPIDLSIIKDVFIIKSLAGTTKYGARAAGGVIIVNTINNPAYKKKSERLKKTKKGIPYHQFETENRFVHIDTEDDVNRMVPILKNNTNELRGLAYHSQAKGLQLKAAQIFREILSLSNSETQTIRDLGHTWSLANRIDKSWNTYLLALNENEKEVNSKLSDIIYREMERLYATEDLTNKSDLKFEGSSSFDIENQNTIRIVLEWSSSSHAFSIEAVNPQGQFFNTEYDGANGLNQRIDDFFLDDTLKGTWLFNFIPNNISADTGTLYLKVSIYRNWYSTNPIPVNIKYYCFPPSTTSKIELFKLFVD